MLKSMTTIGAAALTISGGAAHAQTDGTFLITFDGVVSPQNPTMTVGIWATWDDPSRDFGFGGTNYDLEASEGEFTGGTLMLGSEPPNILGLIAGRWIKGAAIGQAFVPHMPFLPNLDNPILLATYDWTTTDFTPRTVDFDTRNTTNFIVARWNTGTTTQLFPDEFTPGSGVINVVPAPSAWLALPLVAACRRRRRS